MISKFSLFCASMTFSISQFFPNKRHQFLDISDMLCCQDILEYGLENCDIDGLLLINAGLFLFGFLIMSGTDYLLQRFDLVWLTMVINLLDAIYCYLKFQTRRKDPNMLILLFIGFWLINAFQWGLAFLFLVLFTNICAHRTGGNHLC